MYRPFLISVALGFGVVATGASAQDAERKIVECAAIVDGTERLACYDDLAAGVSAEARAIAERRRAEEERLAAIAKAEEERQAALAAAEAERQAALAAAEAAREAEMAIGAEQVLAGGGRAARDLESATFTVKEIVKQNRRKAQIFFENGQVWQLKEDRPFRVRPGTELTIERAMMSGYKVSGDGVRRLTRVVRVR
ncbi:MAG: hypothetical protein AAF205_01160 [Pseudomonadota bacterium]